MLLRMQRLRPAHASPVRAERVESQGSKGLRTSIAALLFAVALGWPGDGRMQAIKPLDVERDSNGVDFLSGSIATPLPVLSIPAASNLRFQRLQDLQPVVVGKLIPQTAGVATYDVNVGGSQSERFDCDEQGDCRSKKVITHPLAKRALA